MSDIDELDPRLVRVRQVFADRGMSVAEWARKNGFSSALTYQVLAGRKRCVRGQSHAIAVSLGLKPGIRGTLQDLEVALAQEAATGNGHYQAGARKASMKTS